MKFTSVLLFSFFLAASAVQAQGKLDSLSYSAGMMTAQNLKRQGFQTINYDDFLAAVKDVFSDKATKIDPNAGRMMVDKYLQVERAKMSETNLKVGKEFLEKNGKRPGVVTTASGLQYEVIKMGEGQKPTLQDKVNCHYHGTLIDGGVFDSSVQRGQPTSFPLNGVIKGWQEGLQLMPLGSKFKFYIPANLAYGERSPSPAIKPNSTLIFEVELLGIEGK